MEYRLSGTLSQKDYVNFVMKWVWIIAFLIFLVLETYYIFRTPAESRLIWLISALIIPLIFSLAYLWFSIRSYQTNKALHENQELIISETSIEQKSSLGEVTFDKSYIYKISYHKNMIVIYASKNSGLFLQRSWLENGTFEELTAFLKKYYDKK